MKPCFITPTSMLEDIAARSRYHLVLAHIYQRDRRYASFYRDRVTMGDVVILDNSAYELGKAIDVKALYAIAQELNPTYVFLPDVRFDGEETLKLVHHALKRFAGQGWKLLGVPQGKDLETILTSYRALLDIPELSGVGLYEEIGAVAGIGTRANFLKYLEEFAPVPSSKYVHLLGMEEDLTCLHVLKRFQWVDSIDSAKPVVFALSGIRIPESGVVPEYPHRPKNYFAIEPTWRQMNLARENAWSVKSILRYTSEL